MNRWGITSESWSLGIAEAPLFWGGEMSTCFNCDRCNQILSGKPFASIEPTSYHELRQGLSCQVIPKFYDLCEPCWEEITNLIDKYRVKDG